MPPRSKMFTDETSEKFYQNLNEYNTAFGISNATVSYSEYKEILKSFSQQNKDFNK